jgi:hypothetical protein
LRTDDDEVGAMNRFGAALSLATAIGSLSPAMLSGQSTPSSAPVRACSLLPKEEVKRHVPWQATFDFMEPEENAISDSGSSCRYPTVVVQVFPSSSRIIEDARQRGGLEALSGIGDEAYFRAFGEVVVEVSVRAGRHIVTVQADVDGGIDASKTRAVNLARALVASLP